MKCRPTVRGLALVALLVAASGRSVVAQGATDSLRLAKIFSDGVVVQRNARIPVWGWAAPRRVVTARFRGTTTHATADSTGRWQVSFPATRAGGPYTLTVDAGAQHRVVSNVMVGDVWVASGQSNMEFSVSVASNAAQAIAQAHDSLIREFKVPNSYAEQPASEVVAGSWAPADPQHVGAFSAVAYFFAHDLRAAERVPIGIVNVTWGGSAIETWLTPEAQHVAATVPGQRLAAERARLDTLRTKFESRFGNLAHDPGLVNGNAVWAQPSLDESNWANITVPALWESQGYEDVDGVAWYRTTVNLTAAEAAQGATLSLGPVDDDDITWVNGVQVGSTKGYNVPRHYTVPASALHAGANTIAVRVLDTGGGGGIWGVADSLHLDAGGVRHALGGQWKFRLGQVSLEQLDGQRVNKIPAITYNQMVHPLLPIAIKGVIWYQGESNANDTTQARAYRDQFRTLVTSWRSAWNDGKEKSFPFLWVQLPNYMAPDSVPNVTDPWPIQRESMDAALALPKTGRAVTIDVGEAGDIHPKDKQDVGHRLALVARKVAYGENVLASGPTYRSQRVEKGRVTVRFANVDGGLVGRATPDGADTTSVGGFAIAGADKRWVWAQAKIAGNSVVVWSDAVPHPVAVRYAWANNPTGAKLYNKAGLPAAPFRTDK